MHNENHPAMQVTLCQMYVILQTIFNLSFSQHTVNHKSRNIGKLTMSVQIPTNADDDADDDDDRDDDDDDTDNTHEKKKLYQKMDLAHVHMFCDVPKSNIQNREMRERERKTDRLLHTRAMHIMTVIYVYILTTSHYTVAVLPAHLMI